MLMHPELLKRTPRRAAPAVLEPGPQHGYAVIESLRAGSGDTLDLPIGKVYPALHRLEPAGLIAGDWQTIAGRRHRAYQLSSRDVAPGEHRAVWASSPPPSLPS